MVHRADRYTKHFRIGVVNVALHTPLIGVRRRFASLYRACQVDQGSEREVRVEVWPKRPAPWKRRYYQVTANGRPFYDVYRKDEILPYVEWAVNWELPQVMPEFLQLHASSMQVNGMGVIFPGHSGAGKSTLTTGLLSRGWQYLCDEFALIHADTLDLHPYPRAICIKEPGYAVIKSIGLGIDGGRSYWKGCKGRVGFINPAQVRPDAVGTSCPIRYVVFPKYVEGATPSMVPINRAQAAFALHQVCLNLFGCRKLGLDVLVEMIRGASCFQLTSGNIQATCDLVQRTIEAGEQRKIRCA